MIPLFCDSACGFSLVFFFFFNDPATTEIYTLSLHDALPISAVVVHDHAQPRVLGRGDVVQCLPGHPAGQRRSEEHTSELQSQSNLVCRLLLEKTKTAEERGRAPSRIT